MFGQSSKHKVQKNENADINGKILMTTLGSMQSLS